MEVEHCQLLPAHPAQGKRAQGGGTVGYKRSYLGRLGNIEFKLQLHPVDRPYIAQIKLIEEATQRLSILEGILNREETHAFPKQYSR